MQGLRNTITKVMIEAFGYTDADAMRRLWSLA